MNKLALAILGAAALTVGSGAQATISACTGTGSLVVSCSNAATSSTIGFHDATLTSPTFSDVLNFTNDTAGSYSISLGSSAPAVDILSAILTGPDGSFSLTKVFDNGTTESFSFGPMLLALGDYSLTLSGNNSGVGDLGGTVTISAVPEPATWAFMLLGFGGMGVAMRRRRRQGLTQLA